MSGSLQALEAQLKRLDFGDRLVRRNPLYYGSTQRQLDELQSSSLTVRSDWTDQRVQIVLNAARRTRYGQQLGAPRELHDWPILQKDSVRDDPGAFRARGNWFAAHASTGGTTGTPLELIRSPSAVVAEQVCLDRMMCLLGLNPLTARVAVLRADAVKTPSDDKPPFWTYALGGRRLVFSSHHLSEHTLSAYLKELREFRPDVLWMHPTMLEVLCRLLARSGESLRVVGVRTSSEMLRPEVWTLARSLLNCTIVDSYGQAERVAFAYAAKPGAYWFLPGYAYVELLEHSADEHGVLYEIVGTSLWNAAMPLVRYRTGDLIRIAHRCDADTLREIAFGVRPFDSIIGRSRDVLLMADGRSVLPGLSHIPRGVAHLLRLQIVQERPDHVVFRVLSAPGFSKRDADQLLGNARSKIPDAIRIDIEVTDSLHRTSSGKTPFVIHSPPVREALSAAGVMETTHRQFTPSAD